MYTPKGTFTISNLYVILSTVTLTDDDPQSENVATKNLALDQLPTLLAELREGRAEMGTISQHLLADSDVYTEIKRDLYNALNSLRVARIDLYGSFSFELAFNGMSIATI